MATEKTSKYMTKTTSFGGSSLTLYSIDGVTWSTRKDELDKIKERQEKERVLLDPNKAEDENLAEAELDKEIDLDADEPIDIDEDSDSAPKKRGRKPGSKTANAAPTKAKKDKTKPALTKARPPKKSTNSSKKVKKKK